MPFTTCSREHVLTITRERRVAQARALGRALDQLALEVEDARLPRVGRAEAPVGEADTDDIVLADDEGPVEALRPTRRQRRAALLRAGVALGGAGSSSQTWHDRWPRITSAAK